MSDIKERAMNTDKIKEIQSKTAYPNSQSVQQALLKVWNECAQEHERLIDELIIKINKTSLGHDYKDLKKKEILNIIKSYK